MNELRELDFRETNFQKLVAASDEMAGETKAPANRLQHGLAGDAERTRVIDWCSCGFFRPNHICASLKVRVLRAFGAFVPAHIGTDLATLPVTPAKFI